jgi:CubicO group peptidase (beta-lactamase class C family)
MVRAPTMFLGAILAVARGSDAAPPANHVDKATVDAALSRFVDSGALVGISALVYEDGREAYFGAFGQADREARRPMARDTLVQIFSMTKPIAGVALMSLYEAGMFQLDDPLSKYCPEFTTFAFMREWIRMARSATSRCAVR